MKLERRSFLRASAALALASCVSAAPIMTTGCNGTTIAQDIVNWTPTLESTAATVASTVAILQPPFAAIVAAALAGFDAACNLVVAEAKAYLANPGQTTLQALQTAVITVQQQVNATLLQAARIVDPKSQSVVTQGLNAVATTINAIFALITQIKGNTISASAPAAVLKSSSLQIQKIRKPFYEESVEMVAKHYNVPRHSAEQIYVLGNELVAQEGF